MRSQLAGLRRRPEIVVMAAALAAALLAPVVLKPSHPDLPIVTGGLYGIGIVSGMALALQALGVVLVYRVNRIINFAQAQIGTLGAIVVYELVRLRLFLLIAQAACPSCADGHLVDAGGAPEQINFLLCLLLGSLIAPLVGFGVYFFLIKRFKDAPRLVVTLLTVAVAQFLAAAARGLTLELPLLLGQGQLAQGSAGKIEVPYRLDLFWSPVHFGLGPSMTVAVGGLAFIGLAVFFRLSPIGTVIRASAENHQRAETLGIRVDWLTGVIWTVAGLLSGISATLQGFSVPIEVQNVNIPEMVRTLAAAVGGGLVSLPLAAASSVALGIIEEVFSWSFHAVSLYEGMLFFLICGLLLAQRSRTSRSELEAASAWRASKEVRPVPPELRDLPIVRNYLRAGGALGTLIVLAIPFFLNQEETARASLLIVFSIVTLSMVVLTGWAGQISLGQFALAGVGAYIAALLSASVPFPFGLVAAVVLGATAATVIGAPAIRLRGLHLAIASLSLPLAVNSFLLDPGLLGRWLPPSVDRPLLLGIDLTDERAFYYVCLTLLAVVLAALVGLRRSRTARALIAARDNELAAQSFGISLVRARLLAFAISGAIAALAGGLFVYQQRALNAAAFSPSLNLDLFLASVVGGYGAIGGPVLGELYVGTLQYLNPFIAVLLGTGTGLMVLLLFAPGGLTQIVFALRDEWLRRIASRKHLVVPSLMADIRVDATANRRAGIQPNRWKTGAEKFIPVRYRLAGQMIGPNGEAEAARPEDENVFASILGDSTRRREE